MDREGFMVSIELAKALPLLLYPCISLLSRVLSSRTDEHETVTDSYKRLMDHDSEVWSEFHVATLQSPLALATTELIDHLPTLT